jgi:sialate O-acetylesterase
MGQNLFLPPLIQDGMVLQRNQTNLIWGKASPGKLIQVIILNETYTSTVKTDGSWEVLIHEHEAFGPIQMDIYCEQEHLIVSDILIGDVWLLGGQSNMELPLRRTMDLFEEEIKAINNPFIRQFTVPKIYNFHHPMDELTDGSWKYAKDDDVLDFSAVGYFFAKHIYEKVGIPIGLIKTAIGGTPAQAWLSEKSLREFTRFDDILEQCKDDTYVKSTIESEENRNNSWYHMLNEKDPGLNENPWYSESYDITKWETIKIPFNLKGTCLEHFRGSMWFQKEVILPEEMTYNDGKLSLGTIVDADETYFNGQLVGSTGYLYPPRRYNIPKKLLREGKNNITVRLTINGNVGQFIKDMPYYLKVNDKCISLEGDWKYQVGATMDPLPSTTFFEYKPSGVYNGMIYPLRKINLKGILWYQGESNTDRPYDYKDLFETVIKDFRSTFHNLELPFLYVQLANYIPADACDQESKWAYLRNEQRKVLSMKNTGMAVTIDLGQYNELHPQDKKSVGNRLALWARKLVYQEKNIVCSGPIYERMERKGNEIYLYFNNIGSGLIAKGEKLEGFTLCDIDGIYKDADARIINDCVIVSCEKVKSPINVRYAWSDSPEKFNLFNKEGLPASPFATE